MLALFFQTYLKLFFVLTPFFAISAFLSLTQEMTPVERKKTAVKVTVAVYCKLCDPLPLRQVYI